MSDYKGIFRTLTDDSFWGFDGVGWVKKLNRSEDDIMLQCNICSIFFGYRGKFQCDGSGVAIIDKLHCFYMCNSAVV